MKRIASLLLLPALALGFMTCSCKQDPVVDPGNNEENNKDPEIKPDPDPQGPQPGTYKFVASPLKGKWEAGDKIYVHGNLGADAVTITLSADAISADGKTATAQLGTVTESPAEPDGLYAAWPAEAVTPYNGYLKTRTIFESCDRLLTAAYLDNDTFTFSDLSSLLSFTVTGDYDQYALVTYDFSGIHYYNFSVNHSSEGTKMTVKNDGNPYQTGKLESGKPVQLWMPGKLSIKGCTIYVGKDGKWPLSYTHNQTISLNTGKVTDLGDITASLESFSGPGPNYPKMTKRTKYKVKFNELSGLCLSADESFLWSVGDQGELAQIDFEGNVLNRVDLKWKSGNEEGGLDTEGITVNPLTGDLWISMEQNYIGVIRQADLATIFSQENNKYYGTMTIFRIPDAQNYGNSGTEGISYYKDNKVYVGAQDGPAHLFLYDLETHQELMNVKLGKKFTSMSEIAGLSYDPLTDWLWVVDSNSPQKMFALSGDASKILAVYALEDTGNPEAICVDHKHSCIWVGDDNGSTSYLYRYEFTGLDEFDLK